MVIIAMVLSILESSPMVFGSGYPKDTTTSWCEMLASVGGHFKGKRSWALMGKHPERSESYVSAPCSVV
jgi:aminoglycoside N3'-acetyltransferase